MFRIQINPNRLRRWIVTISSLGQWLANIENIVTNGWVPGNLPHIKVHLKKKLSIVISKSSPCQCHENLTIIEAQFQPWMKPLSLTLRFVLLVCFYFHIYFDLVQSPCVKYLYQPCISTHLHYFLFIFASWLQYLQKVSLVYPPTRISFHTLFQIRGKSLLTGHEVHKAELSCLFVCFVFFLFVAFYKT